jgi:uncharacterized OsmC-like protein
MVLTPRKEVQYLLTLIPSSRTNATFKIKESSILLSPHRPPLVHTRWEDLTPPEIFLLSLGGCTIEAMLVVLESYELDSKWELGVSGILAHTNPEEGYTFSSLKLLLLLNHSGDFKAVETSLREQIRHCPILRSLSPEIPFSFEVRAP